MDRPPQGTFKLSPDIRIGKPTHQTTGPPPSYAFVTRMYRRSLRPIVMSIAILAGLWSLFSAIGFFRNVPFYSQEGATGLSVISIVLGALCMFVSVVEGFGMFAAVTQRLVPARIFAWLSALVFIVVAGAGLTRTIIHFTMKSNIIDVCTKASTNGTIFVYNGFWGPVSSETLSAAEARDWCNRSWSHDSGSEIIAFLATSFLAALFAGVAFGFYRQLLDPTSVANAWRTPSSAIRGQPFPQHYAPPYNNAAPAPYPPYEAYGGNSTHPAFPAYQSPTGSPPLHPSEFDSGPPGYEGGWKGAAHKDNKNPFGEDEPSTERDLASRPFPGGNETFR